MNTKKTQNSTDKAPELPQVVSAAPSSANGERLGIAAVERDTGLGKDTLRVWERRYGFPLPERDAQGERAYPMAQVQRLRQLRRLLDLGHRPGRVVPLDEAALAALLAQAAVPPTRTGVATDDAALDQAVSLLRSHDADALRRHLSQAQLKNGLATFVTQVLAPLTTRVGEAWMAGTLRVFEEHLYTEVVQSLLRQAIQILPGARGEDRPRVALTTLPGEPHGLGLLMVEALLALEGCNCQSLGVQTPPVDVVLASAAHRSDIVALSFSGYMTAQQVTDGLQQLRASLPADVDLWAGGAALAQRKRAYPGVKVITDLPGIAAAVAQWRLSANAHVRVHA